MTLATLVPLIFSESFFTSLAIATVVARLYTRARIVNHVWADDYLIAAAAISSVVLVGFHIMGAQYGLGKPSSQIDPHDLQKYYQALWANVVVYNFTLTLCKLSIVIQYLRIFPTITRVCKAVVVLVTLYGAWSIPGSIFLCVPVQHFWDSTSEGGCMNKQAFWYSNAALNIVTDLVVFLIPFPLIKTLRIHKRERIGLIIVFTVAFLVPVASAIRLYEVVNVTTHPNTRTRESVNIALMSNIEVSVAIICASIPPLKPLIIRVFPSLVSDSLYCEEPIEIEAGNWNISANH